jgi:hypothetical protein
VQLLRCENAVMSKWLIPLLFFSVLANFDSDRPAPSESWDVSADGQTASVTGRTERPIWKKLNPVWWFLNEDEPDPPEWQLPGKPYLVRQLSWYARNPFQNFGKYVLGVCDRNYTVVGTPPVYATTWADLDPSKTGWKTSSIQIGRLRLPFVTYESENVVWYAGWQWSGFFGFKFNVKNSSVQFW